MSFVRIARRSSAIAVLATGLLAAGCGGGGGGVTSATVNGNPLSETPLSDAVVWDNTGTPTGDSRSEALHQAVVEWRAPSERTDGSRLDLADLAGFRILFGPTDDPDAYVANVDDPTATSFMVNGLSAGSYQFAVVAIDNSGRISTASNTITQQIQ